MRVQLLEYTPRLFLSARLLLASTRTACGTGAAPTFGRGSTRPRSPTLNLTHRSAMLWKLSILVSDAIMTYTSWQSIAPGLSFAPYFSSSRRLSPPRPASAGRTTLLDFSLNVHLLYSSHTPAATPWRPKQGEPKRVVPNATIYNKLCPSSDEVLIARLRELGYTLGIPSIDVDNEPVGTASKDDEEAAEDAKFARYRENAPTFLDRLLAAKEAEVSRPTYHSVDRTALTRIKQARAVETEGDATETAVTSSDESATADALQSLLAVIDEHRESVQAAMAEARRKKGRENDRSGTSSSRGGSSLLRIGPHLRQTLAPTSLQLINFSLMQQLHCPPSSDCANRPPRHPRPRKNQPPRRAQVHLVRQQEVVVRGIVT